MDVLGSGAEATIYVDGAVVSKVRENKAYRIEEIDSALITSRTRREAKILTKLAAAGIAVPKVLSTTKTTINMDLVPGTKVRDCLTKTNVSVLSPKIGAILAQMHALDITHGDLTTSNMIWDEEKIWLIDFGLSQVSLRIEDKAVDLHLLKHALESYHHDCFEEAFDLIIKTYSENLTNSVEILERLEIVEKRGRNKH
jgi:Kae1-associated kinase Bud32